MTENSFAVIKKLQAVFAVSIILLLISSGASYYSIQQLIESSRWVNHTYTVLLKSENVISQMKDAETAQRGYIITHNPVFLQSYNGSYAKVLSSYEELKSLTSDNPVQQDNLKELRKLIERRFEHFQKVVALDSAKIRADEGAVMVEGKQIMDNAREVVIRMQNEENSLLHKRTGELTKYIDYTPVVILIASLISIVITILAYLRIKKDLDQRITEQQQSEQQYVQTSARIARMEEVTRKIADGDYCVRSDDDAKDELGRIAIALNTMAGSLQHTFNELSEKNWIQTGITKINESIQGEKDVHSIGRDALDTLVTYLNCSVGVFYASQGNELKYVSGYAVSNVNVVPQRIHFGETLIGQVAVKKEFLHLQEVPDDFIKIQSATGQTVPRHVLILPLLYNDTVEGVVEVASLHPFTEAAISFARQAKRIIAVKLQVAKNVEQLQHLFEQTQAQAEELQTQHSELEHINAELEIQTQKLQASEEELKVQHEELLQANQELEERSKLLEERNAIIVDRNRDIQRKAKELEQSTKYKSEFLANMSHELRTPLNSILLLSRLLAENHEKNLSPDQVEYAQVIQTSGNGLLSLIDEILDLSKIEAGKMELEYAPVSIAGILGNMKSLFAPVAKEKGIDFTVTAAKDLPPVIETDKMRLEQILKNLISNALKFTAQGSVELLVSILDGRNSLVSFTVKDTGIGIPKEKQQLIFEAFQQADGSTRRKYGGTGLGLSISRELAKLLGGDIHITSEPGQGSEFTVSIPATKPEAIDGQKPTTQHTTPLIAEKEIPEKEEADRIRYTSSVIPQSIPDDRNDISPGDKLILIIEDDIPFAKALLDFTRTAGYKAIVAVRGDEGVELAQRYNPSGILLDLQLPVKDGWEVMEELKADPKTRPIPVHMMSSLEVKRESLSKGAVDFINKPVAFEQMPDMFKKLEHVLDNHTKKVLIIEDNAKHAEALSYYLQTFNITSEAANNVEEGVAVLHQHDVDCVILDMGIPDAKAYQTLEAVKKNPGFENLPVIIFTGKNLSRAEEQQIKQYNNSIVIKTAHSYQRILDEVSIFLHLVEESRETQKPNGSYRKLGALDEVLSNKKILIVDDDVRNIFSLTRSLESHKMNVLSAVDGKEALQRLEQQPDTDMVLMDIMMPEMDGYETIRHIRNTSRFKNLPVIAVTAKAMTGDREKCIRAGASDYISKPVDVDQLLSLLRVWLYEKGV